MGRPSALIQDTYFYFILIVYAIFGYVQDGDKPCMSFERIEIPPLNMTKINIDNFYKSREWEYYEIDYNYDWNVYFFFFLHKLKYKIEKTCILNWIDEFSYKI